MSNPDEFPAYSWFGGWTDPETGVKDDLSTWCCDKCGKVPIIEELARYNGAYSPAHYAHAPNGIFCGWISPIRNKVYERNKQKEDEKCYTS